MRNITSDRLDGVTSQALALELDLPLVHVFEHVGSTMDVAATLGDRGAVAGTLIVADAQRSGRGRGGRYWASAAGSGIWFTLLERPNDPSALPVLPLRIGLRMARVLERWTEAPIRLKWPNDLYVGENKLAGILIEARWREQRLDWIAIGVGINMQLPAGVPRAAHLTSDATRRKVLGELTPQIRAAVSARGALTAKELHDYTARDFARGKRCRTPGNGVVLGIAEGGELLVETAAGRERYHSGSLELES